MAVLSKGHPFADRKCLHLEELCKYPLALFEGFTHIDWFNVIKANPDQKVIYLFDRGAIMDAILDNDSISITMKGTIRADDNTGIREIPICDLNDSLDVFLLKHSLYELNARESNFIEYLQKMLKKITAF